MCTTMIDSLINSKDNIVWVCKYYPAFKNFKDKTEKETNMKVSVVDILRQNSVGSNRKKEDLFNYCIYSKLERRNIQASVIFMITYTQLSMQMVPGDHPHKIYKYEKCGNGVVFNSRFRHQ